MNAWLRMLALSGVLLAGRAAAHAPPEVDFNNVDITGSTCCRDFHLTDHNGKARTIGDFKGRVVVLTFGFTRCPDICPMTMSGLRKAMQALGADAERVTVLFVTLDPERDTAPVLRDYVTGFDPSFIGLRADAKTIARTAKEFRVFYKKATPQGSKSYLIDHTLGSYLFDAGGKPRAFVSNAKTDLLIADLRSLLSQAAGRQS